MPKKTQDRPAKPPETGSADAAAKRSEDRPGQKTAVSPGDEGALLTLSDSLLDGAAVLDAEGKIKNANRRFCEIVGVSERQTLGKRLDALKAFHDRGVSRKLRRLLSGQEVPLFELEARGAAGQKLTLQVHFTHVRRAADPPKGAVVIVRDISDQRRLREQFEASDERNRLFIDNADEGVVVVQDDQIVFMNQRAADLSGFPLQEHLSQNFLEHVHPADRERVGGLYTRTESGEPMPRLFSFRVARADGSVKWAEVAAVVHNWEGRPAYVCFIKDVTERKRMEQELVESERRYRLLAENASDVIWVTDMDLRVTYLSPSIERLLGYSIEESMTHTVEGALTPASAEAVQKVLAVMVARDREKSDTPGSMDFEIRRKDGSTVWVESTLSFIKGPDGQPVEIMGVMRDVTKRRQAEEALREAKAKLDLLLRQMPCVCWTTDAELRLSSCAGGLISDAWLQRHIGERYYGGNGGDQSVPVVAHRRALAGTADSYEVEENGRAFYSRVEPLRDEGNCLVGVVGAAVDITNYRNLVGQLRTLSRRLISVQEDERRTIASELHDQVGQSLTALKLLLEKAQAMAPEKESRQLALAATVVNDLMTRVRQMSLELRPAMLDDLGLLPTLLWHFKRYTDHTQVKVKFRHAGLRKVLPPDVSIAAYRIVQEALTNVARYAEVKEVSVCVRAERGAVLVEVADHGVGFDEAGLAGQPSSGLRGMRERALALDGKFTVKSVPGRGTYVMAELPCQPAATKARRGNNGHNRTGR